MSRQGITFDDVQAQFDLLIAQNESPTIERIQKGVEDKNITGIGGGNTNIAKHLRTIRANGDESTRSRLDLSTEFLNAFNNELTKQTAIVRFDIEEKIVNLQSDLDTLFQTSELLEGENEQLIFDNKNLKETNETIHGAFDNTKEKLTIVEEDLVKEKYISERLRVETAKLQVQTEIDTKELTKTGKDQEKYTKELAKAKEEALKLSIVSQNQDAVIEVRSNEISEFKVAIESTRSELNISLQDIAKLKAENKSLMEKVSEQSITIKEFKNIQADKEKFYELYITHKAKLDNLENSVK